MEMSIGQIQMAVPDFVLVYINPAPSIGLGLTPSKGQPPYQIGCLSLPYVTKTLNFDVRIIPSYKAAEVKASKFYCKSKYLIKAAEL